MALCMLISEWQSGYSEIDAPDSGLQAADTSNHKAKEM